MFITDKLSIVKKIFTAKMLSMFLLGFSSGLPIALVMGTMQAWFKTSGVDIKSIGLLSLIGIPYTFKFLWSPLIDNINFNFLGRRRSWLLITQLFIILTIMIISYLNPKNTPFLLGTLGLILAFFSATQDTVIDAYKIDILDEHERGFGAALSVEGYRVAMLISGGGALFLADLIGWQKTYFCMALLMIIGVITTYNIKEPNLTINKNKTFFNNIKESILFFLKKEKAISFLSLVILYKLSNAFLLSLSTPFLIDIGFSLTDIGVLNKIIGLTASLLGIFLGGLLLVKINLFNAMFLFGILQGTTNLLHLILSIYGKNYILAANAIFIENLCSGMGTAAFLAFLMSLCNKKFSATQFAILTALDSIPRTFIGPISGYIVANYNWNTFFCLASISAIPSLIILIYLKHNILQNNKNKILITTG